MNVLYMDCFSGISGNMTVGAFLDMGVDEKLVLEELKKLNVEGYEIHISKKIKNGIKGTYFDVILEDEGQSHDQPHQENHCMHNGHERNLQDIERLINDSMLSHNVKELSKKIFAYVAEAEAEVHGKSIDEIHFHEVGALDSIVDIVGTAICIDSLNIDKIVASKLHVGSGFIKCRHGLIPIPAPATEEIIKNGKIPTYSKGIKGELATPTGAAILAALADEYGPQPEMEVVSVGYGAGLSDFEIPNVLRLILGKAKPDSEKIVLAETNIDDTTGEILGYVMDRLLKAGAIDVFFTPIYMKKCRPAVKLSFLSDRKNIDSLERIVFKETSTIGIRKINVDRTVMDRKSEQIDTRYGKIKVKKAFYGNVVKQYGEFEDIKNAAEKNNVSIQSVYDEIKTFKK